MSKQVSSRKRRTPHVRALAGVVNITRQAHFSASHRLYNPTMSEAWNQKQYGLCANEAGHGHNYVLEVTVRGQPDPVTGYIIDLAQLKKIMHRTVVDKCDHRNLGTEVDFLRDIIPSTENLVIAFWHEIAPHIAMPARLYSVRLYETPRNFAEFFGPAHH
jgi:6-pyruvoyltetrahydropterin/6-carboxytetrahydropterin synthase